MVNANKRRLIAPIARSHIASVDFALPERNGSTLITLTPQADNSFGRYGPRQGEPMVLEKSRYGLPRRRLLLDGAFASLGLSEATQAAAKQAVGGVSVRAFGAKGDGRTDDSAAFANAFASSVRGGGRLVFVPKGTYAILNVRIPSDTELRLEQGAVILAHPSSTIGGSTLNANGSRNVTISGAGTIDGNKGVTPGTGAAGNTLFQAINAHNIRVVGVTFRNSAYLGIVPAQARGIWIERCVFLDLDCAIHPARDCHDIYIARNRIDGGTSDGIVIWASASSPQSTNISIVSNIIRNKKRGFAIILRRVKGFAVTGNTAENCSKGIDINSADGAVFVEDGIISRNVFKNIFSSSGIGGVRARNIAVTENAVHTAAECGIWAMAWVDCAIAHNTIVNPNGSNHDNAGIRLSDECLRVSVSDNKVVDNRKAPLTHAGIQVAEGCNQCVIARNSVPFVRTVSYGIVIANGAVNTVVTDNDCSVTDQGRGTKITSKKRGA